MSVISERAYSRSYCDPKIFIQRSRRCLETETVRPQQGLHLLFTEQLVWRAI
jgi:hypothetical protein